MELLPLLGELWYILSTEGEGGRFWGTPGVYPRPKPPDIYSTPHLVLLTTNSSTLASSPKYSVSLGSHPTSDHPNSLASHRHSVPVSLPTSSHIRPKLPVSCQYVSDRANSVALISRTPALPTWNPTTSAPSPLDNSTSRFTAFTWPAQSH